MAEPKCPDCGVVGVSHLVTTDSQEKSRDGKAWFNIVYCDGCGHVYGVFAKQRTLRPAQDLDGPCQFGAG